MPNYFEAKKLCDRAPDEGSEELNYTVLKCGLHSNTDGSMDASVYVSCNGKELSAAATGCDTAHALDAALRDALKKEYPELEKMRLFSSTLSTLHNEKSPNDKVHVTVTFDKDRGEPLSAVGSGPNATQAYLQALQEAYMHMVELNRKAELSRDNSNNNPGQSTTGGEHRNDGSRNGKLRTFRVARRLPTRSLAVG